MVDCSLEVPSFGLVLVPGIVDLGWTIGIWKGEGLGVGEGFTLPWWLTGLGPVGPPGSSF